MLQNRDRFLLFAMTLESFVILHVFFWRCDFSRTLYLPLLLILISQPQRCVYVVPCGSNIDVARCGWEIRKYEQWKMK